jgi:DNA-binding transcriptional ArsR family regulator
VVALAWMNTTISTARPSAVTTELTSSRNAPSAVSWLTATQPTVSHHLKILVDAGIFTRDKRGVWAYYAVVPSALDALSAVLSTGGQPARRD